MTRTLEERLEKLEREVDRLKGQADGESRRNWIATVIGSFADDPEFDEIVRLGRELREVDRPRDEA